MYCKNCGQKLEDGDRFCSVCGAKAPGSADRMTGAGASELSLSRTASYEPFDFSTINFGFDLDVNATAAQAEVGAEAEEKKMKFITPVEDFDWNIHSFPGMEAKKTEDIDFNWSTPVEEEKPEPAKEAFETNDRTWDSPEETRPASSLESELFGSLDSKADEAKKQSEEIDKFFTFHEKNEAFQRLLDQEYEKIKSGNMLADEMDSAAEASEKKFASRKSEDPMEDLFASEGVVKGYEPKPVETDVLERIEAAEAEKQAREESARLIEQAKARAEAELKAREEAARVKAEEEARIKAEEEAARLRLEEEARRAADAKAAREAEEREQARAAARENLQAALKEKEQQHEKQQQELEATLEKQAALRQEAEEKARAEAQRKAQEEAEARAAEEARLQAEAEAKAAEEARLKAEAEARAAEEARLREEAEARAAEEARLKAEAEAREKAAREAAEQEKAAAAAKKAEADQDSHISEMVKARETFFGQDEIQPAEEQGGDETPVKTKPVDKAAILAGMATASEMVQRDRAYAAAEAAAKAAEEAKAPLEAEQPAAPGILEIPEKAAEDAAQIKKEPDALDLLEELRAAEDVQVFEAADLQDNPQDDVPEDLFAGLMEEQPEQAGEVFAAEEPEPFVLALEDLTGPEPEGQTAGPDLTGTGETEALIKESENEQDKRSDAGTVSLADTAEVSAVRQDRADEAVLDDEDEDDYTGGKGRVVLKICLVILIVLLAVEIAGVIIKVAMPSSGAARFIDKKLNQVIRMVTGDDTEYSVLAATEDIRQQPMDDKTTLIQAEMGKNKDGNIQSILYNSELKFDPQKDYDNEDINLTQNLADITWYKDAGNKQVYYDQAIVGAVIAYGSQRVNMVNYNDNSVLNLIQKDTALYEEIKALGGQGIKETFKALQIGEIRQAGSQYYVWVSEKVKTAGSGTATTDKVYEMTPEGETMKMVAAYTA